MGLSYDAMPQWLAITVLVLLGAVVVFAAVCAVCSRLDTETETDALIARGDE